MHAKLAMRVGCAALVCAVVALAHHGTFVSYDSDHPVTLKGTVTEFRFTNPHMQLYFDVTDEKGNVTTGAPKAPIRRYGFKPAGAGSVHGRRWRPGPISRLRSRPPGTANP